MEPDPYGGWSDEPANGVYAELDDDHLRLDTPEHTVLMHRNQSTHVESLWLHGYRDARTITVTCPPMTIRAFDAPIELPGVVNFIPIAGRDLVSALTFRRRFERVVQTYINDGWYPRDDAAVRVETEEK